MNISNLPRVGMFRHDLIAATNCDDRTRLHLKKLDLFELLVTYTSWRDRAVAARQRAIVVPDGFWSNDLAQKYYTSILTLLSDVEAGRDLTAYLSDKISYLTIPERNTRKQNATDWQGRDFTLSVYDMHHLHVGQRNTNGKISRTDDLLFVRFGRRTADIVGLGRHNTFFSTEPLTQAESRAAQDGMAMKGVAELSIVSSAEDRVRLLRAGINSATKLNGEAVLGSLVTAKGTSWQTTRWVDYAIDIIKDIESKLTHDTGISEIAASLRLSRLDPDSLRWELNHCDLRLRYPPMQSALLLLRWRR